MTEISRESLMQMLELMERQGATIPPTSLFPTDTPKEVDGE